MPSFSSPCSLLKYPFSLPDIWLSLKYYCSLQELPLCFFSITLLGKRNEEKVIDQEINELYKWVSNQYLLPSCASKERNKSQ